MSAIGLGRQHRLPRWLGDWGGKVAIGLGITTALYTAWTAQQRGSPDQASLVVDLAFMPVTIGAALLAFRAAGHPALDPRTHSAWRTIGFALVVYWCSGLLRVLHERVPGSAVFPSSADVAHLVSYPVLFVGLMRFSRRPTDNPARVRYWMDVLAVLLGGTAIIWYLMLGPTAARLRAGFPATPAALFPIGDLALLFAVAAAVLSRAEGLDAPAFLMLLASPLALIVADLEYSFQRLEGAYRRGDWVDALYLIGQALPGIAAYLQYRGAWRPEPTERSRSIGAILPAKLPYGAVAASSALLLVAARAEGGHVLVGLVVLSIALTWLAFAERAMVVQESARLDRDWDTLVGRIQAASDAAIAMARESMPDEVRSRILADVRRLTGATHAALLTWDQDTGAPRLIQTDPVLGREASRACLRLAISVQRSGQVVVSTDDADASLRELHAAIGARSYAAVPWPGQRATAGIVVLCSDRSSTFRGGTRGESFANVLAVRLYAAIVSEICPGVTNQSSMGRIDTIDTVAHASASTSQRVTVEVLRQSMLPVLDTVSNRLQLLALDDPVLTSRQREGVLSEIQLAIGQLEGFVDEVHLADALERGALDVHRVPFDAVAPAREILDQQARSVQRWALHVEGDSPQRWVLADPALFPRMLRALLRYGTSNTQGAGGELLISGSAGRTTFEVIARGPAFVSAERNPGWAPSAGSRGGAGSFDLGLALSVLRGLVALHGGEVWVNSEGRVSRVGFWLPSAVDHPTIATRGSITGSASVLAIPFFAVR